VVESIGWPGREVAVYFQPGHTVADLITGLAAHLGLGPAGLGLLCRRTGEWLPPTQELSKAGLCWGDRVLLSDQMACAPPEVPAVELVVVSGPAAGLRRGLGLGQHSIGGGNAEVGLQDPSINGGIEIHVGPGGELSLEARGSEPAWLAGEPLNRSTGLGCGQVLRLGATLCVFQTPTEDRVPSPRLTPAGGRLLFNRPPRIAGVRQSPLLQIKEVPVKQRGSRPPISYLIVPTVFAAVWLVFYHNPAYVLFALMMPVMAIASLAETTIPSHLAYRRTVRRFLARLRELEGELKAAHRAQIDHACALAPDAPTLLDRARRLDPRLWERRPGDEDWLLLRLGWWDQPQTPNLQVPEQGSPKLLEEVSAILDRYRCLPQVPMTVSLSRCGVLGLSGDLGLVEGLARWLMAQLAALHSPQDLVLAAAVPSQLKDGWAWLGWLPHLHSEANPIAQPLLVTDRIAARGLLDRLLNLVVQRQAGERTKAAPGPVVVALFHEAVELPRGAVSTLLEQGPEVGVYVIWVSEAAERLPGQCGAVVGIPPGAPQLELTVPATGECRLGGGVDCIQPDFALELALALAPVRDVGVRSRVAGIPRQVGILEVLGSPEDLESWMAGEWIRDRSNPEERVLAAAWGMMEAGQVFRVSLRLDGPHALVGGMTGSGKSELLQSLVASLAACHSPRSLNFLLVDYKGGAAFKDCVELPHTVGFVTDLDGHLVNRALVSLRAELKRREEILRRNGAKDLVDLERQLPDKAPPSLLIVVDEFAALTAELPEFVEGMVDIAQRGRSLGIHLVLATQRPAGVISSKIRANTNLRVALRFSDEAESEDVVGTRDAARPGLPPGRAFARVGPSRPVEFQAGYVGGRTPSRRGAQSLVVKDLVLGMPQPRGAEPARDADDRETDLQRLVRTAVAVNRRLGLPPPRRPWLPALPALLPLQELPAPSSDQVARAGAVIGLLDDPAGQRQAPLEFSIAEDGAMLVFGSSGSGKTTLLRTLASGLACALSPDRLHLYGLDFATRGLKSVEQLPHCGAVVAGDEPQRALRLLAMLQVEAERRKTLLAEAGAASLAEYLSDGRHPSLPWILVLLDGYTGFQNGLSDPPGAATESVRSLVAEGQALGIGWVITSDRQPAGMSSLMSLVRRRLVLRQASDDDYQVLGVPRALHRDVHLPPGRGFTERGYEVQCAVVGQDASGSGQARAIAALAARWGPEPVASPPPGVRLLPKLVARARLPSPHKPLEAVIGLDDEELKPVTIDLALGHLLVTGPRGSGRTTALATLAQSLAEAEEAPGLYLLAGSSHSRLARLGIWRSSAVGPEACAEAAAKLAERMRSGEESKAVIVIDDAEELPSNQADLEWLVQRGRENGLRVVVGMENRAAHRTYGGWLPLVTKDRCGLLLDPDPSMDASLLGNPRLPGRREVWPPGRGYLVQRGVVRLIQVATAEAS